MENNFSEGLLNPVIEWGRELWVGREVGRWCDSPFARRTVTQGCANTWSRARDCCLILQPRGSDKHVPLDLLGAPRGTPVALNDNRVFLIYFCISEPEIMWGLYHCPSEWVFFVVVLVGFVAWHWGCVSLAWWGGRRTWRAFVRAEAAGGLCRVEGPTPYPCLSSLIHAACWEAVAGACCPPKLP